MRLILAACAVTVAFATAARADSWHHVDRPIDPSYLTKMVFGTRSHWIQPWRGYLLTPTTADLRNAMGMNFNVSAAQAPATARQLAAAGIRRARVEISWNQLSFSDPSQMADPAGLRQILVSLRDNGIRPLILVNSNAGAPTPSQVITGRAVLPGVLGTRQLKVDAATASKVVVGRTGLDDGRMQAGVLVTAVAPDGTLTLSRPLPAAVPAGPVKLSILAAEPFAAPTLSNGQPNPRFERTLQAWLTYVGTTTRFVRDTLGSDAFDVEVWNELSFGSQFLDISHYYNPAPADAGADTVTETIMARTAAYLKDPVNGVAGVQIGDGFANQTPWPAPSLETANVTAIDKHPYRGREDFPRDATYNGIRPLNALGLPDFTTPAPNTYRDTFTPSYVSQFPEFFLSGIKTETMIRDLAPIPNTIYGVPHGTADPAAAKQLWITEYNLDGLGATYYNNMNQAEVEHFRAKTALRTYLAYANKGAQMIDLYAAKGGDRFGFLPDRFFNALTANSAVQPGVDAGESMGALSRLTATLGADQPITTRRSLKLIDIADNHDHAQFAGDGTAAHPPLYDRDVLAFLPFQAGDHRFVAGVYVMTRDLAHVWQPGAGGAARFDLPAAPFRLTIGGLDAANATASLVDPLTGAGSPVPIVARNGDQVIVDVAATDSPRLLTLSDDAVAAAAPAAAPAKPTTCAPKKAARPKAKPKHRAKHRRKTKTTPKGRHRRTQNGSTGKAHAAAVAATCTTGAAGRPVKHKATHKKKASKKRSRSHRQGKQRRTARRR